MNPKPPTRGNLGFYFNMRIYRLYTVAFKARDFEGGDLEL